MTPTFKPEHVPELVAVYEMNMKPVSPAGTVNLSAKVNATASEGPLLTDVMT